MSAMPAPFHYRCEIESAAQAIARSSRDEGYRSGYAVGVHDTLPRVDIALGLGLLIGSGIGVVLAFVVVEFLR